MLTKEVVRFVWQKLDVNAASQEEKCGNGGVKSGGRRTTHGGQYATHGGQHTIYAWLRTTRGSWRTTHGRRRTIRGLVENSPGLFKNNSGVEKNSPGLVRAKYKGVWEYPRGAARRAGDRQVDGLWVWRVRDRKVSHPVSAGKCLSIYVICFPKKTFKPSRVVCSSLILSGYRHECLKPQTFTSAPITFIFRPSGGECLDFQVFTPEMPGFE